MGRPLKRQRAPWDSDDDDDAMLSDIPPKTNRDCRDEHSRHGTRSTLDRETRRRGSGPSVNDAPRLGAVHGRTDGRGGITSSPSSAQDTLPDLIGGRRPYQNHRNSNGNAASPTAEGARARAGGARTIAQVTGDLTVDPTSDPSSLLLTPVTNQDQATSSRARPSTSAPPTDETTGIVVAKRQSPSARSIAGSKVWPHRPAASKRAPPPLANGHGKAREWQAALAKKRAVARAAGIGGEDTDEDEALFCEDVGRNETLSFYGLPTVPYVDLVDSLVRIVHRRRQAKGDLRQYAFDPASIRDHPRRGDDGWISVEASGDLDPLIDAPPPTLPSKRRRTSSVQRPQEERSVSSSPTPHPGWRDRLARQTSPIDASPCSQDESPLQRRRDKRKERARTPPDVLQPRRDKGKARARISPERNREGRIEDEEEMFQRDLQEAILRSMSTPVDNPGESSRWTLDNRWDSGAIHLDDSGHRDSSSEAVSPESAQNRTYRQAPAELEENDLLAADVPHSTTTPPFFTPPQNEHVTVEQWSDSENAVVDISFHFPKTNALFQLRLSKARDQRRLDRPLAYSSRHVQNITSLDQIPAQLLASVTTLTLTTGPQPSSFDATRMPVFPSVSTLVLLDPPRILSGWRDDHSRRCLPALRALIMFPRVHTTRHNVRVEKILTIPHIPHAVERLVINIPPLHAGTRLDGLSYAPSSRRLKELVILFSPDEVPTHAGPPCPTVCGRIQQPLSPVQTLAETMSESWRKREAVRWNVVASRALLDRIWDGREAWFEEKGIPLASGQVERAGYRWKYCGATHADLRRRIGDEFYALFTEGSDVGEGE